MVASAQKAGALQGQKLGRYVLRYTVAHGGMATVYLGQLAGARGFEKWVAIKVIHPHLAADRRFTNMFLDEARIAARIRHPNACQVIDFGEHEDIPYLVLEYLHGETLSTIVRQAWNEGEGVPLGFAARAIADAARGLHAAHELKGDDRESIGLVHRDVSPQNVLVLYDGVAKITDFGVAHAKGRITQTAVGEVKGKFGYMSPEQLQAQPIDRRTDVWGLGVLLWEATLGRRLFSVAGEGATAVRVVQAPIPKPSEVAPGYPAALEAVILGALERDLDERTPSAKAFADGLDRYLYGAGEIWGASQVGEWMSECFAERRERRESMLSSTLDDKDPTLPIVELQSHSTLGSQFGVDDPTKHWDRSAPRARPEVSEAAIEPDESSPAAVLPEVTVDPFVAAPVAPVAPTRRRRTRLWAGIVAITVVANAVVWGLFVLPEDTEPDESAEPVAASGEPSTPAVEPAAEEVPPSPEPPNDEPGELAPSAPGMEEPAPADRAEPEVRSTRSTEARSSSRMERSGDQSRMRRSSSEHRDRQDRAEPGTLNLLAIPAAEVFSRGSSLGHTPLIGRELPAGRHRLILRPVGGGGPRSITVVIRSGELTRRSLNLESDGLR